METFLALGIFGLLAAVGWSLTDRSRGAPRGTTPRPLLLPVPPPLVPTSQDPSPGVGVAREHEVADDVTSVGNVPPPPMSAWSAILAEPCLRASPPIPLSFALKWVAMESAGNPCAVGNPAAHGPDRMPKEIGIAQLWNPDDLARLGVTGAELRAYCVPGDQHESTYKKKKIRGFSQALARPLSPAEMRRQADLTVGLIARSAASATRDLVSIDAGPEWSPSGRDFWALVKLQHAFPVLSRAGLPAVTKKLGRPPRSWREFRDAISVVTFAPELEAKRAEFGIVLSNAERAASVVPERGIA